MLTTSGGCGEYTEETTEETTAVITAVQETAVLLERLLSEVPEVAERTMNPPIPLLKAATDPPQWLSRNIVPGNLLRSIDKSHLHHVCTSVAALLIFPDGITHPTTYRGCWTVRLK